MIARAEAARPARARGCQHFAEVRELLDASGVAYGIDRWLVRGLDYYTRTVFEFDFDRLGAQTGVGGGGRYDELVELLGGPATPAVGWAAGSSGSCSRWRPRLPARGLDVFVVAAEERGRAFALVAELRAAGLGERRPRPRGS